VLPGRAATALDAAPIPRVRWIALLAAAGALALLALSARPGVGTVILAEIPLADPVQRVLGVFRSSGRFIWPLTYLLMAAAIARLGRVRHGIWLLLLALSLQAADLSGKFKEFRARFRTGPPGLEARVTSPLWADMLRRCPDLELVSGTAQPAGWVAPALAAGLAGARFHPAPTARPSTESQGRRQAEVQALLASQSWRPGTVYLLLAPLPAGIAADRVAAGLPPGVGYHRLDGHDLVVPDGCWKD
jgi:hypothetical protein